ncbi:lytic polysaccharide monooxygenase [Parathielavia hyrcaniae]|uniref:lytic cellulose monooxygenase (C4-dehydrogenating) n=1 Tax=Parathielavia hyrcaniae TaxID=113614 RepID=A0AAN6T3Z3_9PEZI|nr:lytic polysaccharide monooxygenase [Parathielavia hyrcaniae]
MSSFTSKTLLSALAAAASVSAHGHVTNVVINGVSYPNYDPFSHPYMQNPPTVIGWTAGNTDNGFVAPSAFDSGDIICHRSATNAGGHAVVAAGDKILLQWDTWPESHHGPVIDYLADCGDAGCETVDKMELEFFKIDEVGLVDGTNAPGFWGSDQLIANNNSWMVQIPSDLAPGNYVLRHEIIALHSGGDPDGAQNYPQCINLQVTGSGTAKPAGTLGTALYKADEPGIQANIYSTPVTYENPGPALIENAVILEQTTSAITASGSATTGSATAAPAPATSSAASDASTTEVPASPTTTAAAETSAAAPTTAAAAPTTTTAAPVPTRCPGLKKKKRSNRRHARDVRRH